MARPHRVVRRVSVANSIPLVIIIPPLQARLRPALLALLGDADGEVRGQAVNFWHSALPQELDERWRILLADSLDCASVWVRLRQSLHLFSPPRIDQMSDSDYRGQHQTSNAKNHIDIWRCHGIFLPKIWHKPVPKVTKESCSERTADGGTIKQGMCSLP